MTATRRALTSGLWLATAMALYTPAHAAVGRTAGAAAVSPSGEAQYTVPIFAPPGTAGMTPQLALSYGSHGGDALLGVGWSVAGLSAIYRCDKTWAQDGAPSNVLNDNTDRFCRDGLQLKLSGGTYGQPGAEYRTEIETFARITSSGTAGNGPASFTVEQKDGLIYDYGMRTDSQIEAQGQSTIRTWALSTIRDRAGNRIDFYYDEDTTNGSYQIARVEYTANSGASLTDPGVERLRLRRRQSAALHRSKRVQWREERVQIQTCQFPVARRDRVRKASDNVRWLEHDVDRRRVQDDLHGLGHVSAPEPATIWRGTHAKCRWNWRQHEHPRTTRTARTSTSAAAAKSVAARDLSGSSEYECSA